MAVLFIAKNNLKRKKSDVAVLFFLMTLGALLLYTCTSVFLGMNHVLDRAYEKAHSADLLFLTNREYDKVEDIIYGQEEVTEHDTSECLLMDVDYKKAGDAETKQMPMVFGAVEDARSICTLAGYDKDTIAYDGIVLPYYLKASEGFCEGDACELSIGGETYTFQVAGFVEDPLFATPLNVSTYSVYISRARMEDMATQNEQIKSCGYRMFKVRLKEGCDSFEFDKQLSPILSKEAPLLAETTNIGLNWKTMRGGVSMMSRICMGVVLIFSLLLITVVLIVIRFSIHNFLERNQKNIGILQAAGYTSGQLNAATVLEMAIICTVALVLGITLGVAGNQLIGAFQGIMLGISWNQRFHTGAAVLTIAITYFTVLSVAYLCGRKYRRLPVLNALRGGIHTHNFKKNHFPLEKSRLPKVLVLAGKNLFCEKGQSLSTFCIVSLLAFAAYIGLGLYENFGLNHDTLMRMIGVEAGDMYLTFSTGDQLAVLGNELETWPELDSVLYYSNISVHLESNANETDTGCDVWRDPQLLQNEMLITGRLPKYENEIVLSSSIAKILEVTAGDTIYATCQGERLPYVISGIDQKINNMGLKVMLNEAGAMRLNGTSAAQMLHLNLADGMDFETVKDKLLRHNPQLIVSDSKKQLDSVNSGVTIAMLAICIIFLAITVFVVTMVELLLVTSRLIREQKNMGLYKALGFTTGQLVFQTMMMNLPVMLAGSVTGMILGILLSDRLCVLALSFCGIEQCHLSINPLWMFLTVAGIMAVAASASFLASVRVKSIEPVRMLGED